MRGVFGGVSRDGGYAWVVLLAGFMLNVFTAGNFAILGIFLVEFLHHFEVSKATVTWIGAIQMCVGNFAGLGLGPMIRLCGTRVVAMGGGLLITAGFLLAGVFPTLPSIYIFYGACASVGFLAIHMAGMVAIQQYFVQRRALANGIFMTGFSIGTFALPPLVRTIIDHYSWAGALVVVAGVMMHSVFFGALLRPIQRAKQNMLSNPVNVVERHKSKDLNHKYSNEIGFWRSHAPFLLFLFGFFLMQMGHMTVYIYTPMRCDSIGVSKQDASYLLSIMGIAGLFARPAFGWLGDRSIINKTVMFGTCGVLVGVLSLVTTQLTVFPRLVITSALFGTLNAGYIAVQGAVLVDTAGIARIEVATGIFMADIGLANFMLHMSSGYILDHTGDPGAPFLIFGVAEVLGGIVIICVPQLRRRLHQGFQYGGTIPMTIELSKYEGSDRTSLTTDCLRETPSDHELKTILKHSGSNVYQKELLCARNQQDISQGLNGETKLSPAVVHNPDS